MTVSDDQPRPVGRPSAYTPEIADEICDRIADGEGLRGICRDTEHLPTATTVHRWLISSAPEYAEFRERYGASRLVQAHGLVDETLDISDDAQNDYMERLGPEGQSLGWQANGEHIQRSRLRVDTRKWFASKVLPRIYGDKLQVEDERPPVQHNINLAVLDPETLAALAGAIAEAQRVPEPTLIGQSSTSKPKKAKKAKKVSKANGKGK